MFFLLAQPNKLWLVPNQWEPRAWDGSCHPIWFCSSWKHNLYHSHHHCVTCWWHSHFVSPASRSGSMARRPILTNICGPVTTSNKTLTKALYPLIPVPCHLHCLSIPTQVTDSVASFSCYSNVLWHHFQTNIDILTISSLGIMPLVVFWYPPIIHTHIFVCFPATRYKCHSVAEIFNWSFSQFERQVGIIWSAILSRCNSPG